MRSPEKEEELNKLPNVICLRVDVTEIESIKKALADGINRFGQIDAVVNNAGYGLIGPFEASTSEQIKKQFDTNVFGVMNVTKEILPYFRERKEGTICNIASVGGRITFPLYSLYHATKWAVEGFSESLQHELLPFNINVKIVEPGPIKTDFYDRSADVMKKDNLTAYDSYVSKAMQTMNNTGQNGARPEVVARTIYKAVTSNSLKLRYQPDITAKLILILRKILPDRIFNGFMRFIILR
jgi:short-subunit dehydrogenase